MKASPSPRTGNQIDVYYIKIFKRSSCSGQSTIQRKGPFILTIANWIFQRNKHCRPLDRFVQLREVGDDPDMFPVLVIYHEVNLWLPARDLHHAVQSEVVQVLLLPKVLVDLTLGDAPGPHGVTAHANRIPIKILVK